MNKALPSFELAQVLPGRFRFPTRMTVLPLDGAGLCLVSPIPVDEDLAARIGALGEVRFLVAPNLLHHLYLGAAALRWPEAKVLAPAGLRHKRPDLRVDGALEDGLPPGLLEHVRAIKIEGAPTVDEFVLLHHGSGSLVVTDLVFHVTRPSGLMAHVMLFLVGCHGRLAQSRAWRLFVKDRAAAARSARELLALSFDTLVPAHGDVLTTDAHASLERALRWMVEGSALAPVRPRAPAR